MHGADFLFYDDVTISSESVYISGLLALCLDAGCVMKGAHVNSKNLSKRGVVK